MSEQTDTNGRSPGLWPENILGPRPGLKEINLLCWALFCLCIVAPICFLLMAQFKTGRTYYESSSVDFVYLYGVGQIADQKGGAAVYDSHQQIETFNRIVPLKDAMYGPSPYPPFVPQFFRLFSRLSFGHAFLLWAILTLAIYVASILLLLKEFLPQQHLQQSLILCFSLAYYPFLRNTLANGQLSVLALCALAAAVLLERRGHFFMSGIAVSILAYKPPLLIFVLPMIVLTRRFKAFWGFVAGSVLLVVSSSFLAGPEIWPTYLRFLKSFGQTSGLYGKNATQLRKYVDLNSFSYAIPGGRSWPVLFGLGCICVAAAIWLAVVFLKLKPSDRSAQGLPWSATIAWTTVVNVYFPIYDSIVLVVVVIVSLEALRELGWTREAQRLVMFSLLIVAVSWVTEAFAKSHGVQLLTFVLLGFAVMQTRLLQRAAGAVANPTPVSPLV
jgi:Glycosyltransferase family 87